METETYGTVTHMPPGVLPAEITHSQRIAAPVLLKAARASSHMSCKIRPLRGGVL